MSVLLNLQLHSHSNKCVNWFSESVKNGDSGEDKSDSVTENGSVIINHETFEDQQEGEGSHVITTTAEISPPLSQTIGKWSEKIYWF